MRRTVQLTTLVLYLAILAAPVGLMAIGVHRTLSGALPPDKRPALSLASVRDESYQRGLNRWFENHRTLFGLPAYADNTFLYWAFGETRYGARIVLGHRPPHLFIDEDIGHLNLREVNIPQPEQVDALVARIARAQQRLRGMGKSLVPVIAPAKTSVFPEQVDPAWRRFEGESVSDRAVYRTMVAALDARGVQYVDMRAELTSGRHDRALMWGPEARHWSYYAACLVWQLVLERHQRLLGGAPVPYPCKLGYEAASRTHAQFDLWRLLNVWGVPRSSKRAPIALHDPPPPGTPPGPRVLFVGTSFGFEIIIDADRSKFLREPQLLYYDSQLVSVPTSISEPMSVAAPGWPAVRERKDVIILDLMEAAVFSGHQYLEHFLQVEAP